MKSLAVKYRPTTFEEVCAQNSTVKILKKIIENKTPKNAYLFCGESGCGKTTIARIFANQLNNNVGEPIEIDAASNNGVDQVRSIISSATQRSLVSEYKIFIIDEAHAITSAGWQAFLKGIEEPSPFTIFMFCTTEPHKIPKTILNRVQKYTITKIPTIEIKERLEYVCSCEGYINYQDTCDLISKLCNGCMRDALMLLDQCSDLSSDLALENTKIVLGESPFERMLKLTNCLIEKKSDYTLLAVETLASEGRDLKNFIDAYLDFTLDLIKYCLFKDISMTKIPIYLEKNDNPLISVVDTINFDGSPYWLNKLMNTLLDIKATIKYDTSIKNTIEAYLLNLCS